MGLFTAIRNRAFRPARAGSVAALRDELNRAQIQSRADIAARDDKLALLKLDNQIAQMEAATAGAHAKTSAIAQLSQFGAADTGRRNEDWNGQAPPSSADLTIIPETQILNGRARQLVRDCWIAESIIKAWCRNIVGPGVKVIPAAVGLDGKPLTAFNAALARERTKYEQSKDPDIERKQTFAQKQHLAVRERATVGQHIIAWSYAAPRDPITGKIDKRKCVGLKIQSFEPEQLDQRIYSYQGNEVRGGIEVDANGAAVAYHLYTRNPNDYLFRRAFWSKRVPRDRVWHYFREDRVLQTQGVTPLAPVMQDIRDLTKFKSYYLWKVVMEACIGLIFERATLPPIGTTPGIPQVQGSESTTNSGDPIIDFIPGMTVFTRPGETVKSFNSGNPTTQFEGFNESIVRGIGAGVGLSYGQTSRKSEGNYSAARQDMLEDQREWIPEGELLQDDFLRPHHELFVNLAAMEGRFDGVEGFTLEEYLADPHRFTRADYIPPPQPWIDPEKEANAYAVLLVNKLITREEIAALRGDRFYDLVQRIAAENAEITSLGMSVPDEQKERDGYRDLVKQCFANRLGTIDNAAFNATDIPAMLDKAGIASRDGYTVPILPITTPPAPGASPPPSSSSPQSPAAPGATKAPPAAAVPPAVHVHLSVLGQVGTAEDQAAGKASAPNYRRAIDPAAIACTTCSYNVAGTCVLFGFKFDEGFVCDAWAALPISELPARAKTKTLPPTIPDGERGIMRDFQPNGVGLPPPE